VAHVNIGNPVGKKFYTEHEKPIPVTEAGDKIVAEALSIVPAKDYA
jgi:hypothetical protein